MAGGGGSGAACALRNSGSAPAWQALLGRVGAWEECPDVEEAAPAAGAATDQVDAHPRGGRDGQTGGGRTDVRTRADGAELVLLVLRTSRCTTIFFQTSFILIFWYFTWMKQSLTYASLAI